MVVGDVVKIQRLVVGGWRGATALWFVGGRGVRSARLGGERWARSSGNAENLGFVVLKETLTTTAYGRLISLPLEGPKGGVRRSDAGERTVDPSSVRKPLFQSHRISFPSDGHLPVLGTSSERCRVLVECCEVSSAALELGKARQEAELKSSGRR